MLLGEIQALFISEETFLFDNPTNEKATPKDGFLNDE
jgi:hypothetical protein